MITILKLTNGHEIVGRVTAVNEDTFRVNKPLSINYRQFIGGTPQVYFNRYVFFSGTPDITFKKTDVMNQVPPRESFQRYYAVVVDNYYAEMDTTVDAELNELVSNIQADTDDEMTEEEAMKRMLAAYPTKGSLIN